MPEHRIRFRGGWERLDTEGSTGPVRRLTLPIAWSTEVVGPIRLVRRFAEPPIDPATESIRIEFRQVAGLRGIELNGIDLGSPPVGMSDWTVPLVVPLAARNTLILEVVAVESPELWGSIALVIGPRSGPWS